ncbi:MAG: cytochrome P450 [Polyangiaceae bacterium]|nr:cytochrome P450 [Polyangiaceae bacterium]
MPHAAPHDLPLAPGANRFGHLRAFDEDRIGTMRALARMSAPLVRARFLHREVYVANSVETTHELLVERARSFEKSPGIRILLRDLAGEGLFTSEGELWRRQRRLMAPLFHADRLDEYTRAMRFEANRALDRVPAGARVDLAREMTRITMGVVASTLFGTDTAADADALGEALTVALGFTGDALASPWLSLQIMLVELAETARDRGPARLRALGERGAARLREPVLLPGARAPEFRRAIASLDRHVQGFIETRRAQGLARGDLLTKLLGARDPDGAAEGMSDRQIRDEAKTLFVAGHETTATALTWALYLLARHPEARARVQAEADAFDERPDAAHDPSTLVYTTRVFKEALRLYPPLVMIARRALEPVVLGGVALPARAIVFASPYALHFREELFARPEEFDPERFTPEAEAARHKSAWIPFGVGPRVCIGNHFALLEGPIVLATWMKRATLDVELGRPIEPDRFATLRPKGEVWARVTPRGVRA